MLTTTELLSVTLRRLFINILPLNEKSCRKATENHEQPWEAGNHQLNHNKRFNRQEGFIIGANNNMQNSLMSRVRRLRDLILRSEEQTDKHPLSIFQTSFNIFLPVFLATVSACVCADWIVDVSPQERGQHTQSHGGGVKVESKESNLTKMFHLITGKWWKKSSLISTFEFTSVTFGRVASSAHCFLTTVSVWPSVFVQLCFMRRRERTILKMKNGTEWYILWLYWIIRLLVFLTVEQNTSSSSVGFLLWDF